MKCNFIFIFFVLFVCTLQAQELALVRENNLFGYLNRAGEYAITPTFKNARSFSDDLACVYDGKLWGYVDRQGQWVILPKYEKVKDFNDGIALVKEDKAWFYIDKKGTILSAQKERGPRYKGTSIFKVEEKIGLIDQEGKHIVEPKYDVIQKFESDYTAVSLNEKWGIIDYLGNEILAPLYQKVGPYKNGLTWVVQEDQLYLWNEGERIDISYIDKVVNLDNPNYILVQQAKNYGIINAKGEIVIPIKYEDIHIYSEGLIPVKKEGYWGYVDAKGEQIIDFIYENAIPFSEAGIAAVRLNQWGFITKSKKVVIPYRYDISIFNSKASKRNNVYSNGLFRVKNKKKWGFIDADGNLFTDRWYQNVEIFN
ncbi:WG repeat-containing protein [Myroides odoratus]|uniref:WG repeat-containing protein n=1 Tax=Myroides odoratus TaxID=256 RepID=UPI0039B0D10F